MRSRRQLNAVALPSKVAGSIVTFQTKCEDLRPLEQPCIHAAVRNVAGTATIDTDSCMFKDERPTLVDMTLHARFFVLEGMRHHAGPRTHAVGWRVCSVRVVTIGALHEAFVYAMLDWHRKLRLNVGMAAIAEIGLWLGKQLPGCCRLVHRMAVGADNIGGSV